MKDITIILPIHKVTEKITKEAKNAFESVKKNQDTYTNGKLELMLVGPKEVINSFDNTINDVFGEEFKPIKVNNTGETDYCSQINLGVSKVKTEHFSILEIDDTYIEDWFEMASKYYYSNESVTVFLPINVLSDEETNLHTFLNEMVWTSTFSKDLGYIDYDCLQDYPSFNLTGGIFNTSDFKTIGGLKPSIKVAFNYEFLLRATKKDLKVFVVPKEGYIHSVGYDDTLTDEYVKTLDTNDFDKWFELAKIECHYVEDRGKTITTIKEESLK